MIKLSAREIGATVHDAIEQARNVFPGLPGQTAGSLLVDSHGLPIREPTLAEGDGTRPLHATRGGAWPSGPSIDHVLIEGLIERFGRDGAKLIDADGGIEALKTPAR